MTDQGVISFMQQRMKQRGIEPCAYHWEYFYAHTEGGPVTIRCSNEFFYLADDTAQVEITSDSGYFNYASPSATTGIEFTGLIVVTQLAGTPAQRVHFIRATLK